MVYLILHCITLLQNWFQIQRGLSSGQQSYETDPSLYPVNKPIPKIESQSQCTGLKLLYNTDSKNRESIAMHSFKSVA
jgi:hypothetical protein